MNCSRDQQRQNETLTDPIWSLFLTELPVPPAGVTPGWDGDFSLVDSGIVRGQLYQLNVHKSMGPDGICPRVFRELANVMAGAISLIYERSWESEESLLTGHLPVLFQSKKRHEERHRELQKGFSNPSSCRKIWRR